MNTVRKEPQLKPSREGARPRSPSEALEPGRAPPRPRGTKIREPAKPAPGFVRFLSGLLTITVIALAGAGSAVLLLTHHYEQPGPLAQQAVFVVPPGEGRNEIAERLEKEGIITSRWAFMANYFGQRYALQRNDLQLKAGEYEIKAGASMREVLDIIASGKSVGYRVSVPEGLTSQQIVERMKTDTYLAGEITAIPSEGSLAPDTYSFTKGADRNEIVTRMQAAQQKRLDEAWEKRQKDLPIDTKEQALVLASIVEKETGATDERAKVAAVFVNRLRKGMPLQSDPTILYGVYGGAVQWGKPILQSEKDAKNAHNTYQIKGLPPTPICNPGAAAIEAVLNPAESKDLYFVADGKGGHIFSETLKDHNTAVANWRKAEKDIRAREAAAETTKEPAAAAPVKTLVSEPAANPVKTVAAEAAGSPAADDAAAQSDAPPAAAAPRQVVVTVPTDGVTTAIPSPPAESAGAAPQAVQASTVPLPVRKPKK